MCLPDLWSLLDYWRKHPPVHLLVASYLGYKPPDPIQIAAANERAVTRVSAAEFDRICADLELPPMPTLPSFPSP